VVSLLLWFENQNLFCAWLVYMHPTLSKRLSTLELYERERAAASDVEAEENEAL